MTISDSDAQKRHKENMKKIAAAIESKRAPASPSTSPAAPHSAQQTVTRPAPPKPKRKAPPPPTSMPQEEATTPNPTQIIVTKGKTGPEPVVRTTPLQEHIIRKNKLAKMAEARGAAPLPPKKASKSILVDAENKTQKNKTVRFPEDPETLNKILVFKTKEERVEANEVRPAPPRPPRHSHS